MATLLPLAAHAQFFGTWDDRPRRQQRARCEFFPFFDRPYNPQQQYGTQPPGYGAPRPEEFSKAPPPRKLETQPASTIVVIGNSLADWLAYGLEEIYADQPQLGVERRIRPNSGLIHYEPRNDTLEWSQAIKDILATEKPAAIVVMLGLNDRVPFKVQPPAGPSRKRRPEGKQPAAGANTAGKPEGKQPAAGANGRRGKRRSRSKDKTPRPRRSRRLPRARNRPKNNRPPPRPNRSTRRRAALTSFTPTNGRSFTQSASTT